MMFKDLLSSIFPTRNQRELKRIYRIVDSINALEPQISRMSDDELRGQSELFKKRIAAGETTDDLLPEAFAVVRESGKRVFGMRHFDSQLIGGIVLHEGKIAEMKTGEGKTLVATLPVYLNALEGKGVHVITVNDYLARRDSEWMGHLYHFLGLTTGIVQHDIEDVDRKAAYAADVTYGTNNEFGFDYLRDNMKYDLSEFVQRGLHFAIVDEVDSILIDEARTPLIISGQAEESTDMYVKVDRIMKHLKKDLHFKVDEKLKSATLTDEGNNAVEELLGIHNLYDVNNISWFHHVLQALKAHHVYRRDVEYVVKNGEVIIVDEFTGRLMPGRRWGEGLHQAVEAKEKVAIQMENQTLATVTFQNFFRMYGKLSGMTGTADTEATEFHKIYGLDVVVVPTNRKMIRHDLPDQIYRTNREKNNAIVEDILARHKTGQPILVGTVSIEKSEHLASLLREANIPHNVLNAKFHELEAEIVAQAGRLGMVTIATNMAGRGTDILLGGNSEFLLKARVSDLEKAGKSLSEDEMNALHEALDKDLHSEKEAVMAAGGLHIIGTERHESRRIDNQLRGRSGRQGDPGSSRFYLSLEDDLLRIFGAERIKGLMERMGVEDGVPIEHGFVSKAIENAQKKVENYHFDIRKQLIEYDDVMNQQRLIFYEMRKKTLKGEDLSERLYEWAETIIDKLLMIFAPEDQYPETWDLPGLCEGVQEKTGMTINPESIRDLGIDALRNELLEKHQDFLKEKESLFGSEAFWSIVRYFVLQNLDSLWKEHLLNMDHLKEGIGLRGYGQKDPLVEYRREGFDLFESFIANVEESVILLVGSASRMEEDASLPEYPELDNLQYIHPLDESQAGYPVASSSDTVSFGMPPQMEEGFLPWGAPMASPSDAELRDPKIGRNDLCPCGSGKKYKKCHGQ
jgi:preprotein translocase subunit SecA|nr:preprotein translocase subunit SecA [Leptospirillum ferrooxidans]